MARDDDFNRRIVTKIGRAAMVWVRPKIPSRTLRKALNLFVVSDTEGRIQIPHYWALYVHNGRGPFSAPAGRYLVWFRNPKDDPRLRNGVTPVRASQLRHLTPSEYYHWLQVNAQARKEGRDPPMVVTRAVRKGTPPNRFFATDGGMRGFPQRAQEVVREDVLKHIRESIGKGGLLHIEDEAVLRF